MKSDPQDDRAIEHLQNWLGRRVEGKLTWDSRPDEDDRTKKNPDAVLSDGANLFVVEHTRRNYFAGKITEDQRVPGLFSAIEKRLNEEFPENNLSVMLSRGFDKGIKKHEAQAFTDKVASMIASAARKVSDGRLKSYEIQIDNNRSATILIDESGDTNWVSRKSATDEETNKEVSRIVRQKIPKLSEFCAVRKSQTDMEIFSILLIESRDEPAASLTLREYFSPGDLDLASNLDGVFQIRTSKGDHLCDFVELIHVSERLKALIEP